MQQRYAETGETRESGDAPTIKSLRYSKQEKQVNQVMHQRYVETGETGESGDAPKICGNR